MPVMRVFEETIGFWGFLAMRNNHLYILVGVYQTNWKLQMSRNIKKVADKRIARLSMGVELKVFHRVERLLLR